MGYYEVFCQLCGVSFNINRIRTAEEPRDSAWGHEMLSGWIHGNADFAYTPGDCSFVYRGDPHHARRDTELLDDVNEEEDPSHEHERASEDEILEYDSDAHDEGGVVREENDHGDSEDEGPEWTFRIYRPPPTYDTKFVPLTASPEEKYDSEDDSEEASKYYEQKQGIDKTLEHIAGPGCKNTQGYHGHCISVEEMRACHMVQCLAQKGDEWAPEHSDLDSELQGKYYLTGIVDHMPAGGSTLRFAPARHSTDIRDEQVEFYPHSFYDLSTTALPFHPTCFELFSRVSRQAFGHVDIDTLVKIRDTGCLENIEFPLKSSKDVRRARGQFWTSEVGTEYLAANPVFVPALKPILPSAISEDENFSVQTSTFKRRWSTREFSHERDPFLRFPREMVYEILNRLGSPEIAALRLSSRAFEHIPSYIWQNLVVREMPWLYEAWSSDSEPYYWATADATDLKNKQKAEEEFQEKIAHECDVVGGEMSSMFEDLVKGERKLNGESPERQELLALSPVKLPKYRTNWYKLYRDVTLNWGKLKGLQNRKRIWGDMLQLMDVMKWVRDGRVLKYHKFYNRQRWNQRRLRGRQRP